MDEKGSVRKNDLFLAPPQSIKKVEVQEALLPLNRRGGLLP